MSETFRVLTLNCWGVFIPCATVRKDDRLRKLMQKLHEGTFDVVLLQEIWTPDDYNKIKQALSSVFTYSYYYYQHVIGSGLCIFSKWPIERVFFLRFSCNGYPHRLSECDWYGGKGVGFAQITIRKGFKLNLYDTHFIARYQIDHAKDTNEGHRMVQLLELMQFIQLTADSADAVIVTGDFNTNPAFPAMKLFRAYLGLCDAWFDNDALSPDVPVIQHEFDGCTCDRADNPYSNKTWTTFYGNGERLDYLFYRDNQSSGSARYKLRCDSCWLDVRKVPDDPTNLHYSDHEGLAAQFTLSPLSEKEELPTVTAKSGDLESLLHDIDARLIRGMQRCSSGKRFHMLVAAVLSILLGALIIVCPIYPMLSVLMALSALLGATLFALFWGSFVGRRTEWRAMKNARQSVAVMLANLPKDLKAMEAKQGGLGDMGT